MSVGQMVRHLRIRRPLDFLCPAIVLYGLLFCWTDASAWQRETQPARPEETLSTWPWQEMQSARSGQVRWMTRQPSAHKEKETLVCDRACRGGIPQKKRNNGFFLNLVVPLALGSWLIGDGVGAILGSSAQLGGLAVVLISHFYGVSMFAGGPFPPALIASILVGAVVMALGYLIPLITVFKFQVSMWQPRRATYQNDRHDRRRYRRYREEEATASVTSGLGRAFATLEPVQAGIRF